MRDLGRSGTKTLIEFEERGFWEIRDDEEEMGLDWWGGLERKRKKKARVRVKRRVEVRNREEWRRTCVVDGVLDFFFFLLQKLECIYRLEKAIIIPNSQDPKPNHKSEPQP